MKVTLTTLALLGWILYGLTFVYPKPVEPEVQFELSGADQAYIHGEHCIDGRSF